jgi:ankyrin repeat protein
MNNIFQAALHNDKEKIQEFLKTGDVNITDDAHSSLLHYAARGNSLEVAELLLDNYINLNIVNNKGETPLFEAISRGELAFCKLLCRYNVDSTIINKMNENIYFKAIIKGRMDILDFLEETLQNPNSPRLTASNKGVSPLSLIILKFI